MSLQSVTWRSLVALVCLALSSSVSADRSSKIVPEVGHNLAALPMSFEINQGQADADVRFVARGPGYNLLLSDRDAALAVLQKTGVATTAMRFGDGNASLRIEPIDPLPGEVNYLLGSDPSKWRLNVPHFSRIRYRNAYPGVDVVFYGNQQRLEYDLVVAPGGDPARIALQFDGAAKLSVDASGSLILETPGGRVAQDKPVIYQQANGVKTAIDGHYVVKSGNAVGFEVDRYDASRPLVIDPTVGYFTYFGVGGDEATSVAVDDTGNVYMAGQTTSNNFPRTAPLQNNPGGGIDAFITKFTAGGRTVSYSTYIGGSGDDIIRGIAVGGRAGNVFFTGQTSSPNFPTFAPSQGANGGGIDAFVGKLNAAGNSLDFSTFLGGAGDDKANAIILAGDDAVFVGGSTGSPNFPMINPAQGAFGGGPLDGFVAQFDPTGGPLQYSTFVGGSGTDEINGIAVDPANPNVVWFTGGTDSANFPTTPGAPQAAPTGSADILVGGIGINIVTKRGENNFVYSSTFGGKLDDVGTGIAMNLNGILGVVGRTASPDFPTVQPAQPIFGGQTDGFLAQFNTKNFVPGGPMVVTNQTFLGGNGADTFTNIATNAIGQFMAVGRTNSRDLITVNPLQNGFAGGDADCSFFTVSPDGKTIFATPFGGPGLDGANAAVFDLTTNTWWVVGLSANPSGQLVGFMTQLQP